MLIRRETKSGSNDLHVVYRPSKISEIAGNDTIKNIVTNYLTKASFPHATLFVGDAGCGKTTLARVVALSLNCENKDSSGESCLECDSCKSILNSNSFDVTEINVGSKNGKASIDAIVADLASSPFKSKHKVIIFDECHLLTTGAKAVLLKHMEDCYSHVFLMFCTNEPEKLMGKNGKGDPFLDRCTQFTLDTVSSDELRAVLINVCQFDGVEYTDEILDYICEVSKGVPRKGLVSLSAVIADATWDLTTVKQILSGILIDEDNAEVIELSRSLIGKDFKKSCKLFEKLVKKYPVESIRIAVCGYFVAVLKRNGTKSVSNALTQLTTPIYLTGKPAEHLFFNVMFKVVTHLRG